METSILFASLFSIATGAFIFNLVSGRMHAKPWLLLVPAFLAIILTFGFQVLIDDLVSALDAAKPKEKHFEDLKLAMTLINTIVGAFSGALIGTAISNRALHLHSKEIKSLNERKKLNDRIFEEIDEIGAQLSSPDSSYTNEDRIKMNDHRNMLISDHIRELREIRKAERALSI
ncbi:hypothetical protein N8I74_06730 [Chitiniphilus purpureus]|uniref:Uncharacterized protein n=1 Tax=Chitiniphilus purpureus TaxID=2981137 RepID=A0ABY6DQS2_9NEIS|nr:hypothetical protein [Chitiniphilus sp. CD1]UXY16711.1 hypothetical protein N8I74_06730 [Chitiniphilus sp. CD1]